MIKHFYIFRHGQCPLNVTGHVQGQKFNGSLTEEGRRQASCTADKLKDKQITLIVTSPMKRAVQTALIIAEKIKAASGLEVVMWDERCTTVSAHTALNFTDTRGKKRKDVVDAVAAVIILEDYLAYRKNKG